MTQLFVAIAMAAFVLGLFLGRPFWRVLLGFSLWFKLNFMPARYLRSRGVYRPQGQDEGR
ncbi:hypothetical protein [Alcaligenes sp. WGS1538]|uniref:hypothetical protein n=1 Tax=Alcaligenes sp. WGS1538 TaxID=3366811 RepID=UPI00372CF888